MLTDLPCSDVGVVCTRVCVGVRAFRMVYGWGGRRQLVCVCVWGILTLASTGALGFQVRFFRAER